MCDNVFALEGDAFRTLQERQRYQQFIREEGAPLLAAYRTIEDEDLRRAILHLVRLAAAKKAP